jgi:hypothetical protein
MASAPSAWPMRCSPRASEPTQWRESLLAPRDAAAQAIALAANAPLRW